MEIYVITGGPGTGKSSLINYIEIKYHEFVIREAAEDYIRFKQNMGQERPWEEEDFQKNIMQLQLQRRRYVPDSIDRMFLDRDVADGLAYNPKDSEIYRILLYEAERLPITEVFLMEDLGFTDTNGIRKEDHREALELGIKIEEAYRLLGYEPIMIPNEPIDLRAERIMRYITSKS